MLRLLLDEHITPTVADGVKRTRPAATVIALRDWRQGAYLGRSDTEILAAAYESHLTFVTYDLRTIPSLLRSWAERNVSHGGVIYIDPRTISQSDIGGLVRALGTVIERYCNRDWTNQTQFLEK